MPSAGETRGAGFAITLVSASIAHLGRGDARNLSVLYAIDPLVFFGLLMVSYYYFAKTHSPDTTRQPCLSKQFN